MDKKKTIIILLIGVVIIVVASYFINKTKSNKTEYPEISEVDVKEYMQNNAESIISTQQAKKSKSMQSEEDIIEELSQRGFDQYDIIYNYSKDGKYIDEQNATNAKTKHPVYQTMYVTSSGEMWSIIVTGNSIIANPVSYNLDMNAEVQTVISENETVVSYDSKNNEFYETIPKSSELVVKVVNRIDTTTLDSLTEEVLKDDE